jgi:hypothetical protein
MMTDAAAVPGTGGETRPTKRSKRSEEYRAVAVVSLAHFVNHFHNLVVPPLFPFLTHLGRFDRLFEDFEIASN